MRRATKAGGAKDAAHLISIHALRRGGRLALCHVAAGCGGISIHALREEDDVGIAARIVEVQVISIHALREEGDRKIWAALLAEWQKKKAANRTTG